MCYHQSMGKPLYEKLYSAVVNEIRTGNLRAGSRLPSVRQFAAENGVSINTVLGAYGLLLSEGYVTSREKSGFYVSEFEEPVPASKPEKENPAEEITEEQDSLVDLSANLVDSSLFPFSTLRQLYRQTLSGQNISILENAGPFLGEMSLRRSIASYVFNHKGIDCVARQVVIGNGSSFHLQMIPSLFGQRPVFLMEEPGFRSTREIVMDAGCEVAGIPVDDEGADIAAIRAQSEAHPGSLVILHISPSHQFPLGTTMTASRRSSIMKWASESPLHYVIEDDYDSDFRYNGHPIAPLKSMDTQGKVIYLGTFSRTLTPSIRMSYMILPDNLLRRYEAQFSGYPCPVSRIDQKAVSLFMDNGHFERHINRMRRIYRARRNAILNLFAQYCPEAQIKGEEAGLHFTARFDIPEKEVLEIAWENGFRMQGTGTGWVVVGYSHLSDDEIRRFGQFTKSLQR